MFCLDIVERDIIFGQTIMTAPIFAPGFTVNGGCYVESFQNNSAVWVGVMLSLSHISGSKQTYWIC